MPNCFERAAVSASAKTNRDLAYELSRLTRLTEAQLAHIVPSKSEKEQLVRLLAIVCSAGDEGHKVDHFRADIDALGPVAIRLVQLLAI